MKKAFSLVLMLALIFAGIWTIQLGFRYFGVTTCRVKGESMAPTYHDGDLVFISAYALRIWGPRKGDVVVFRDRDDVLVIKRIVRVSGEVDDVTPFAKGRILGTNEYVVLGDNTNNSMDSRTYGTIVREQMIGIVK